MMVLMFFPAVASASRVISLDELPRLVRSNSPALTAARAEIRIKKIELMRPLWNFLPGLEIGYSGGWNDPDPNPAAYGWTHGFGLSSSWSPIENATRFYQFRIAQENLAQSEIGLQITENEKVASALSLYWDAISAWMLYETALSNESVSRTGLDFLEAQKELGRVPELEVLSGRADYDNAQYETAKALTDWQLLLVELGIATGLTDVCPDLSVLDRQLPGEIAPMLSGGTNRPLELLQKDSALRILRIQREDAFRQRVLPSVRVSSTMDWWSTDYKMKKWTTDGFKPGLSFSVSYPLFERNEYLDQIRVNDLKLKAGEAEREGRSQALVSEYDAAVKRFAANAALLPIAIRRLESAQIAVESLRESSRLGITPLMDLLQAEKDLRSQRIDLIKLRIYLLKLRTDLGKKTGDPLRFLK
jgi:outer membrane protein TolC